MGHNPMRPHQFLLCHLYYQQNTIKQILLVDGYKWSTDWWGIFLCSVYLSFVTKNWTFLFNESALWPIHSISRYVRLFEGNIEEEKCWLFSFTVLSNHILILSLPFSSPSMCLLSPFSGVNFDLKLVWFCLILDVLSSFLLHLLSLSTPLNFFLTQIITLVFVTTSIYGGYVFLLKIVSSRQKKKSKILNLNISPFSRKQLLHWNLFR